MKFFRKFLKWTFISLGSLIGLVLLAMILIPIFFKAQLVRMAVKQAEKYVNADVTIDADKFSLSFFRDFPNLTVTMVDLGVIGRDEFKGDTLCFFKDLTVGVDFWSLFGSEYKVNGVYMDQPVFNVLVTKEGKANYDIAKPSADTAAKKPTKDEPALAISIEEWEMKGGAIVYDDKSLNAYVQLVDLNIEGNGSFKESIFDTKNLLNIKELTTSFDGISYLYRNKVLLDLEASLDLENSVYTLKKNDLTINDFALSSTGSLQLINDAMSMNFEFATKQNTFKSLVSLIPAVFLNGFEKIQADGNLQFAGKVNGEYGEFSMPAFQVDLKVDNAMFKYPDLPKPISNIGVDLTCSSPGGNEQNNEYKVDIRKFHMDFDKNPVDAVAKMRFAKVSNFDANVKASLLLEELSKFFPIEAMELKGLFTMDANVKGDMDVSADKLPIIDAKLKLQDGMVKSKDYPIPMEKIQMATEVSCQGAISTMLVSIDELSMLVDQDPFACTGKLDKFVYQGDSLSDLSYDLQVKGKADLEKIMKIYPVEGMELKGKLDADIAAKGNYAQVMASQYDRLQTSGKVNMTDFVYKSVYVPKDGLVLYTSTVDFTPTLMKFSATKGKIGKSDFVMDGSVSNYIGYMFKENEVLKGNFNYTGNYFDVDEWMVEETPPANATSQPANATAVATVEEGPFLVPTIFDFTIGIKVKDIKYDNMNMTDATGKVIMRDGKLEITNFDCKSQGGALKIKQCTYSTQNEKVPYFGVDMAIQQVVIAEAFKTFNTIEKLAPISKHLSGNMSSSFRMGGELGSDMFPVYSKLTAIGNFEILKATIKDMGLMEELHNISKLNELKNPVVQRVKTYFRLKEGAVVIDKTSPMTFDLAGYEASVYGLSKLDGSIDYTLNLQVPFAKLPSNLASKLSGLTASDKANLTFDIKGTFLKPVVKLETKSMKDAIKDEIKEQIDKAKEQAKEEVKETVKDATKEVVDAAKKDAQKAVDDLIKGNTPSTTTNTTDAAKKQAEEAAKKAKEEAEKAKDKAKNVYDKLKGNKND